MNINITKSAGVVLKTQGKYCAEDITVVPTLEEKSVTPTESAQEIVPSDGNCGISKVNVGAIPSDYIIPSGTLQITDNGAKDVTNYKNVNVNVPTSGGVEEVATAAAMNALLVEANVGKYYKFTGPTDSNYTNGNLYLVESV